mgnify:FL=1
MKALKAVRKATKVKAMNNATVQKAMKAKAKNAKAQANATLEFERQGKC